MSETSTSTGTSEAKGGLFPETDDGLVVLTEDSGLSVDLGQYCLEIAGRPGDFNCPVEYRVYDTSRQRGVLVMSFSPPQTVFTSEAVLDRYTNIIADLLEQDAVDVFREAVATVGDRHQKGLLFILPNPAAKILQATKSVEYDATGRKPWTVYFDDSDIPRASWGLERLEITAEEWADDSPILRLPNGLPQRTPEGDDWRKVRFVWALMHTRDVSVRVYDGGDRACL